MIPSSLTVITGDSSNDFFFNNDIEADEARSNSRNNA